MIGYIGYRQARESQSAQLGEAIPRLDEQVRALSRDGSLAGEGPVLLGIGASYAAAAAPVWHLRARGIDAWRLAADDSPLPLPRCGRPLIGISQSGRSAETIAALDSVSPSLRWAVVNNAPSPLAGLVDRLINLGNIPDSYASTIGYTATIAALSLLAEAWDGGSTDPTWATFAERLSSFEDGLPALVEDAVPLFGDASYADMVGVGASVGSAEAAALLFREVARIPATGMSTRQYLHGAMESAGDGVHVLFGGAREADIARMLAARGHRSVLVTPQDIARETGLVVIRIPAADVSQRAIVEIVVMQELVEAVTHARGIDVEEFVFHNEDTKVSAP
ncbi:MAG: SIS domain-containing protein [Actinobacteria bacterium]|nr:SIS domain-containing protein [Actinomycetota bacterium]